MSAPTLTDELRDKLRAQLGTCPTCGHTRADSLRGLAKKIGTSAPTLSRWLNGGKHPDAETLNKVWAYLALTVNPGRGERRER